MTLSVRIMAHPSREAWATGLSRTLDAPIIWDEKNHPWDTGRRALLSGTGDHVMVIQDDSLPSEGLVEAVNKAVEYSGDNPVGLFTPDTKWVRNVHTLEPQSWWVGDGPTWGVAIVIPVAHVKALVKFGDLYKSRSYDQRIWHYYQGADCWYTVPSLVDHRIGHGSLLGPGRDRHAYRYGSGLGVDWSLPPVEARKHTVHPTVIMEREGVSRTVRKNTPMWRRLQAMGWR